jgi:hypothetical protein
MKTFKAISGLLLALLVLVSSTSFTVGMHFCMGKVKSIALFTKAEVCEKERSQPPCHRHASKPCCEDETVVHRSDDFKTSISESYFTAPVPAEIQQHMLLIAEIIPTAPASTFPYFNYDPPLRSCDITVEHRVFLI